MSNFDPNTFLSATTTEAATRRPPIPAGRDFVATIGEPKARQVQGKKDASKSYVFIDFPMEIDLTQAPDVQKLVGQDKVQLNYGTSLDMTEGGALDWTPGRNNGLRLMRTALDMNIAGQPFNILAMQGRQIRVKISHEEYPEGSGEMRDRVSAVAKV
jgi:hypothetical protein